MHIHRVFLTIACAALLVMASAARAAESNAGETALQWWIERAEQGSPNMQYGMGQIYAMGNAALGVQRDETQAAMWYRRAAEQGYAEAQFALGLLYEDGRGVARDANEALAWYRRAAGQGHMLAKEKVTAAENASSADTSSAPAAPVEAEKAASPETPGSPFAFAFVNRTDFWDWWQGALALAFVTLAFWWIMRTTLGVSSSWDRIVHWRDEEEFARKSRAMFEQRHRLNDAMMAETVAQFGEEAVAKMMAQRRDAAAKEVAAHSGDRRQIPWQAHVTFLAMMMIGGLIASVLRGDFHLRLDMGAEYARLIGSGPHIWLVLLTGGFLIGFGTRMAGGCSSGHGLSGCARLQPGSLAATGAFFGMAVVTSLILEKLA